MEGLVVPPGALAIWGLGQMGVALKGSGPEIVYIDPCLSDIAQQWGGDERFVRAFPPPLEPHEVRNAAYVLCSHEHGDHADPLTLGPLATASPAARFVANGWCAGALDKAQIEPERRILPPTLEPVQLGPLRLTAVPSAHYELEHDERGHRWLGFWIEWNGVTFYHSGDTIVYPGYLETLRGLGRANIAMLAVNGRDAYRDSFNITGNLLPAEAAWLARELGWELLIGGHNDLYSWNTIRAGALADACAHHNPRQRLHILQPGELYLYHA
jgi:L-ascorbate metabolism protein UlaG (beta-lactamase superfamily)